MLALSVYSIIKISKSEISVTFENDIESNWNGRLDFSGKQIWSKMYKPGIV